MIQLYYLLSEIERLEQKIESGPHYELDTIYLTVRNQQESLSKVAANLEKHLQPKKKKRKR